MRVAAIMAGLAAVAAAGAAIATTGPSPVAGTVAVSLVGDDGDDDGQDQPFADAVGQALGDANYTLLPDHSRYIAEVSVAREHRGIVTGRAPKAPASAAIGSWGPAIAVPLGSKKTVLHDLVATTLTVSLVRRADHARLWRGSAMTADIEGAPVATKLARAAFAAYPQTMDGPVSVP